MGPRPYHQQTRSAVTGVTQIDHITVQHGADGDNGCRCRTGQSCEECTGQNQCQTHSTADVTHQAVCKFNDAARDATFRHQVAGQNEERNGHDGGGLQATEDTLCNDSGGCAKITQQHSTQGSGAQRYRHRHANDQAYNEYAE